eukprot:Skav227457  [mRNA]  locus=scaffold2491:211824:225061:+ [translate_table: standard]
MPPAHLAMQDGKALSLEPRLTRVNAQCGGQASRAAARPALVNPCWLVRLVRSKAEVKLKASQELLALEKTMLARTPHGSTGRGAGLGAMIRYHQNAKDLPGGPGLRLPSCLKPFLNFFKKCALTPAVSEKEKKEEDAEVDVVPPHMATRLQERMMGLIRVHKKVGEIVEILSQESPADDEVEVMRVQCRAIKDDLEGWVTVSGAGMVLWACNEGSKFLADAGRSGTFGYDPCPKYLKEQVNWHAIADLVLADVHVSATVAISTPGHDIGHTQATRPQETILTDTFELDSAKSKEAGRQLRLGRRCYGRGLPQPVELHHHVTKKLDDPVAEVRAAAFQFFGHFPSHLLKGELVNLVNGLEDPVAEVRAAAFQCLCNSFLQFLEADNLKLNLAKGLPQDPVAEVRTIASQSSGSFLAKFLTDCDLKNLNIASQSQSSFCSKSLNLKKLNMRLLKGLQDTVAEVRMAAFQCLGNFPFYIFYSVAPCDLKQSLVKGLDDPVAEVRAAAFKCSGHFHSRVLEADDLKQSLVKGIDDPVAGVRAAALQCLGNSPSHYLEACDLKKYLVKGLDDPVAEVRAAALQCLGNSSSHFSEACDLKQYLVKGLDDPVAEVRAAALQCLGNSPSHVLEVCDLKLNLVKGLQDPVAKVRATAFQCVGNLPSNRVEACNLKLELLKGLDDPVSEVRAAACQSLRNLPSHFLEAYEVKLSLAKGVADPVAEVRASALQCSGNFLSQFLDVCDLIHLKQILVKGLNDPLEEVRALASQFVGQFPSHFLEKCGLKLVMAAKLTDSAAEVRVTAYQCLSQFTSMEDLKTSSLNQTLPSGLQDPIAEVRVAAIQCLYKFYSVEDLVRLHFYDGLEDPVAEVRAAAFQCLCKFPSLKHLETFGLKLKLECGLEDSVAEVRAAAFEFLGCLGKSPSHLLEACDLKLKLTKGQTDPVDKVRSVACKALRVLQPLWDLFQLSSLTEQDTIDLALTLEHGLKDPAAEVRAAAFQCLCKFPSLEDLSFGLKQKLGCGLEDSVAEVRAAAFECLGCLGKIPSNLSLVCVLKLNLAMGQTDPVDKVRNAACEALEVLQPLWDLCQLSPLTDLETYNLKSLLAIGWKNSAAEVRAAAFECLGCLGKSPSKLFEACDLKLALAKGQTDPVDKVRNAACEALEVLQPMWDLCQFSSLTGLEASRLKIILEKALEDPVAEVRAAAFQCLCKFPSLKHLETFGLKLKLECGLEDSVAEVRAAAFEFLGCLGKIPSHLLQACDLKLKLAKGQTDPVDKVRSAACKALQVLQPLWDLCNFFALTDLEAIDLKIKLEDGLRDPVAEVRAAAFECLGCLGKSPSLLWQARDLKLTSAKGRTDPVDKVRSAACKALEVLRPMWELDQYLLEQVKALKNIYPDVRHEACLALSSCVSPKDLAKYSSKIVRVLGANWELWPSHAPDNKLHASIRLVFKVPVEESLERNTWLHIAARGGHTNVCQALLASGLAMKSLRNAKQQTASDVARLHGHSDLARYLSPGTFQTRGGSGGAIAKALDSEDLVEEVSWWFIPLPRWEGKLGAVHSILKVDTGSEQYLIEGACPEKVKPEGVQRPEIEKAVQHGLFTSSWAEIKDAANIEKLTHVKPCRPSGIMLAALVEHLLQQGPYDVGCNNCHHTAFHGYNFCAREPLPSCGEPLPFLPIYAGIPRDETVTMALPRHWTGEVRNGAVDLGKGSDEFLKIEAYLKRNGGDQIPGFQIIDIKRNQNLKMLRTFRNELYDMHRQRQLRVFHSASDSDVHDKVMKEGFRMAYSNLTFNAFGAGIYFAQDLRLPDHFSPKSDAGLKQVLLCCVAAGKSHMKKRVYEFVPGDRLSGRSEDEWRSELRKTEHRQAPDGYDSCVADSGEALIVYRESQVLWEYAIQYKSTGSAGNPYGDLRGLLKEEKRGSTQAQNRRAGRRLGVAQEGGRAWALSGWLSGLIRLKCKCRSDGAVGWVTAVGNAGTIFLEVRGGEGGKTWQDGARVLGKVLDKM